MDDYKFAELTIMLNNISDSYFDFVVGIMAYAKKKPERIEIIRDFIIDNPTALTSDIIEFVSEQPDFLEENVAKTKELIS